MLHVLDMPDTVTIDESGAIATCGDIDEEFVRSKKEIADRNFENISKQYPGEITTHLRAGKVTDTIVEFTRDKGFDLVVMGTKGAWGIKEKVSGSTTQMIVRQSHIPVLSMMCDRSQLKVKNILLVHDFTNPSKESLSLLKIFIQTINPRIHFLQIINESQERLHILSKMDEFASVNGITNYEKHLLNDSDIESGVIHFNQMHDMDLICIGTHGRTGISRIIHPSETEKLINHLFKPIISFHLND